MSFLRVSFATFLPLGSKVVGVLSALVLVVFGGADVSQFTDALGILLTAAGPILIGEIVPRAGRFATWAASTVARLLGSAPDLVEELVRKEGPRYADKYLRDALQELNDRAARGDFR